MLSPGFLILHEYVTETSKVDFSFSYEGHQDVKVAKLTQTEWTAFGKLQAYSSSVY